MSGNLMEAILDNISFRKSLDEKTTMVDPDFYIFIDKDLEEIVGELNSRGITIDVDKLNKHLEEFQKKEQDSISKFKEETKKQGYEVNINSRNEILNWFFKVLKMTPFKKTKTGPSLDSESLQHMAETEASAQYYLDAKSANMMVKMLQNIKNALRDGKIYPQHNLNKAASGRFSSSGGGEDKLNINGWPKSIRDMLKPEEGTIIVSFDYKNFEQAVAASMAGQEDLLDDMESGVDLHQKLADLLGVDRKAAKIVNHGVSYGMTAFGMARKIGCTEEEAQSFIDKYWEAKSKIRNLKQDVIQTAKLMGYVATISDFRRPSAGLTDEQIWSTFCQGSAADLFKQALALVTKYLKSTGYGKINTPMHDCIVAEIGVEHKDEAIKSIVDIMEHIHPKFRLKVDVEVEKW